MIDPVVDSTLSTLGAACEINPARPNLRGLPDDTPVMFVPMAAVDEVTGSVVAPEERQLGELRTKSYRMFTTGDVIFAKITPSMENGKSAVVPEIGSGIGFGSTEFHVLRPQPGVVPSYIWHLVRQESFRRSAREQMTGSVGQERVPTSFLESFPFQLPREPEQVKEVERLDRTTGSARSATLHLARASVAMERFQQSVLFAAISGRLTADWRNENEIAGDAQEIVASISHERQSRLGQRYKALKPSASDIELPNGWCWITVGALVDVATGATPLRTNSHYFSGTIPWVTSGAVNAGLIIEPSEYITELAIKETNTKVFPEGTLLVAMYGEGQTRGRVAELGIEAATNQAVAALLFSPQSECLRGYLKLFFLENYERIRQLSFGGVQPNLSLGVIRDTLIPLPPLEEQEEIVKRVNQLSALADDVRHRIAESDRRVTQTSQAILARAFCGELADTNDFQLAGVIKSGSKN